MKRSYRTIVSLLMACFLTAGLTVPAFAADSTVTYNGKGNWDFAPGSGYTDTDLFDGFKNVMPGDVLNETITIKNEAKSCDYIKVYLQAIPHDEDGNPLTYDEDFEEEDGKATGSDADRDETVATMKDFLAQLNMRVYQGEKLLYEASPDETDGLNEPVYLTSLRKGKTAVLNVELEVPITMGNEYAYRVGEVDWKFLIEERNDSSGGGGGGGGGSSGGGPGESTTEIILPFEIPLALPQTGTLWWLVPILAIAGGILMIGGRKKQKENEHSEDE